MKSFQRWIIRSAEFVAATLMAAMFLTFILQISIRYGARSEWLIDTLPFLDPDNFGWTLEFCLLMWIWIVFLGNAFIVREQDHVTFDIFYLAARPEIRKWLAIVSALVVAGALLWSLGPTLDKFHILRLKRTATLGSLFGDWIRVRHIYSVYLLFLLVVGLRYLWRARQAFLNRLADEGHHHLQVTDE